MSKARVVAKKILSVEQSEGVGARVRRSVGRPEVFNGSSSLFLSYQTLCTASSV